MRSAWGRWWKWLIFMAALSPLLGVGGLHGIRAVESYDPFCTACHLRDHQDYLDDGARPKARTRTLAGWHKSAGGVRCISCHGEEGIAGMMRTTILAGKDLYKFVIGDFEQPSRVFHPIPDKDCGKCHDEARLLDLADGAFHAIADHAELKADCVQCHNGHRMSGAREKGFLVATTAQPRCDACHDELEQKVNVETLDSFPRKREIGG